MQQETISLYELNSVVKGVLNDTFNQRIWIKAEMSDVRINQNGHCYLEFIEKDSAKRNIIAKARGSIWSSSFRLIKAYFESETGQVFTSGLKVLVQISVEFHELYGYSLNVHNIDPSYTLGDQAKNRAAILKQLEEEGVLNLNKELNLPLITNRIAVISSPTAAGFEDFSNQLNRNNNGFVFYTHLFPAIMQGDRTENSIISALEKIYDVVNYFDAVVIIRGGGATSDLNSFDSYLLAANCAQFPLPIITGIGHERDDTVLDLVAHTRAKTPTAVAEFLIDKMDINANNITNIEDQLIRKTKDILHQHNIVLNTLATRFSYLTKSKTKDQLNTLKQLTDKLKNSTLNFLQKKEHELSNLNQFIELSSPQNILKKGYTLTLKDNKIMKSAKALSKGENIKIRFSDGEINSTVN